jgi:hypothetical protein
VEQAAFQKLLCGHCPHGCEKLPRSVALSGASSMKERTLRFIPGAPPGGALAARLHAASREQEACMELRIYLAAFALSIVIFNPHAAFGQESNTNVSATYTLLRDTDSDFTFARGMSVGAAWRVHEWLFVGAELALSGHHQDYSAVQGGTYDFRYQSIQAGPRVVPLSGPIQPYAEVIAGVTRFGIWERRLDRTGEWGSPDLSVQPGLGVDMFVSSHVALRFSGDIRLLFRHDQRFDKDFRTRLYRFNAGLAIHLGRQ